MTSHLYKTPDTYGGTAEIILYNNVFQFEASTSLININNDNEVEFGTGKLPGRIRLFAYNNTFWQGPNSIGGYNMIRINEPYDGNKIINNIFCQLKSTATIWNFENPSYTLMESNDLINFNLYYRGTANTGYIIWNDSEYNRFTLNQADNSFEPNGEQGNPSFKDGLTPNDDHDFVPVIQSPAYVINKGSDLNNLPYNIDLFTGDYCNPTHSRGTSWNRGAFEETSNTFQDEIPGMEKRNSEKIKEYYITQNYPNPFNPTTTISYSLSKSGSTTLKVFDILGREIITLVNEEKPAGSYTVEFNASNLSSGIYFYSLTSGSFTMNKKMILMK
ncbi:MAG: T9SS type A sorting domain-containing protein [Syntrophothermus sp.]